MLLIIVLSLMAKLALVSGDCDVGTLNMSDFDWTKVGISVLTCLLSLTVLKTAA